MLGYNGHVLVMAKAKKNSASRRAKGDLDSRLRAAHLSDGQIKLLKSHGLASMSEAKIRDMTKAHKRFLASAKFQANSMPSISLSEAEQRVERYLKTLD